MCGGKTVRAHRASLVSRFQSLFTIATAWAASLFVLVIERYRCETSGY